MQTHCASRAVRVAILLALPGLWIGWPQKNPDYQSQIQPIFANNCYACHNADRAMGGIRLDAKPGALGTGDSGNRTIIPGNSAGSELIRRVTASERNVRMPLAGEALPTAQIQLLRAWVDAGAPWPESAAGTPVDTRKSGEMIVSERDRQHWAYRPLQPARPPAVRNAAWTRNPVDRFILAALEAKGLKPGPEASKEQLIRRASFTLTGLPPSPEEIEAFRNDRSAKAYETVVERLLASTHFGERWGRHWLDVARYADSEGYNRDRDRPLMYRYRDFVIQAMNSDMPFDQFVRWQLAGDEYEPDNPQAVTATGFLAAGPSEEITITDTDENKQKYYYDELDDFVSTTSLSMLGLTVGCARCHDHKFDAIPTRDYYRLVATFRNVDRRETFLSRPHRELERWLDAKRLTFRAEKIRAAGIPEEIQYLLLAPLASNVSGQVFYYKQYGDKVKYTESDFQAWLSPEDRETQSRLKNDSAEIDKRLGAEPPKASIVDDKQAEPEESFLLGRGSVANKNEKLGFGFLSVMTRGREPQQYQAALTRQGYPSTFQRSALAEWLVDSEHGAGHLLARVIVNRLWQHHFGEGLVRTTSDFGLQGDKPSHPELLDYLAQELIRSGWRLKTIHRMIMTSAVYRLSTRFDENAAKVDPDNRLLSRRRPMRIEGEILRDSILAISGSLNRQMYGPGVRPPIPPEVTLTRSRDKWPKDAVDGPETWRRSIYIFNKRAIRYPWLETFDAPDGILSCGRRVPTTVPTQSLALLNDSFVRQQANLFAARLATLAPGSSRERVERAYQIALGRRPSSGELDHSLTFLSAQEGGSETDRLADFCHTLITLNEFFYVD